MFDPHTSKALYAQDPPVGTEGHACPPPPNLTVMPRFRLIEKLAERPATWVYRVEDRLLRTSRVLKWVQGDLDAPAVRTLLHEWELLGLLRHPRIVSCHGAGIQRNHAHLQEESCYLVLESIEGQTLLSLLATPLLQPGALDERLLAFTQLLTAVAAVHLQGLRCGDLKPENVLIDAQGVHLIDFGLTRESGSLEVSRVPIGTLPYLAPELLAGQVADQRADCFSLGVILFQLLQGELPFPQAQTPSALLAAWRGMSLPARTLLLPDLLEKLPEALLEVLDRLLALHAPARYPQVADVFFALQPLVAQGQADGVAGLTLPSLPEPPLTGRAELLAELLQHFSGSSATGKSLECVLLQGPTGSGRSRLLEALEQRLLPVAPGGVLRLTGPLDGALLETCAALVAGMPLPAHAPEAFRTWIQQAQGPLALLLDELPLELPPGAETATLVAGFPQPVWCVWAPPAGWAVPLRVTFQIPPLDEGSVRTLVEQATGLVRAPETIQRFLRFSEGNPGILHAILLHPDGMRTPGPALSALLDPIVAPSLLGLNADALELAKAASVLLEPFSLEVLAAVLELPRDRLGALIEALGSNGVLEAVPEGGWRFVHPMGRAWLLSSLPPRRLQELHQKLGRLLERRTQLGLPVANAALAWHWDHLSDGERARRYLGRALRDAVADHRVLDALELAGRLLERIPLDDPERVRLFTQVGDLQHSLQRFPLAEQAFASALLSLASQEEPGGAWAEEAGTTGSSSPPSSPTITKDPLVIQLTLGLLSRLARAREERGDFVGARQALEQALELAAQRSPETLDPGTLESPPLEPAQLQLALARVLHREGRLTRAREVLERLTLEDPLETTGPGTSGEAGWTGPGRSSLKPDELLEGALLSGLIRLDSGELEGAARAFSRALELSGKEGAAQVRMRALHNLHLVEVRRGNLPRAVEFLQGALELAEAAQDVARLGAGYNNLGNLQRRLGDVRKALKSYQRAARTFERVGDRAGLVTVLYSQARLLHERAEHTRALELLDQADQLAHAIGGGFREQAFLRTRLLRGETLLALGRPDEARTLLEPVRLDAERSGDLDAALTAELSLAEVSLQKGERQEVEARCAELATRTLSRRLEEGYFRTLGRLHLHLGHYYTALWLDRTRSQNRQLLGAALLEAARSSLPPGGALVLRRYLSEASELQAAARLSLSSSEADGILQALGASAEDRLILLGSVLDVLQSLHDRKQALEHLVVLATRVLRAERGLLIYWKDGAGRRRLSEKGGGDRSLSDRNALDVLVRHGIPAAEGDTLSREIVRRVLQSWSPVVVPDALEDPSLLGSHSIHDLQIRSVLGLPLEKDEGGAWILYLDHRHVPAVFSSEEKELTPLLARLRQFAAGLLKEIRWRELHAAQPTGTDSRRLGMVGQSRAIEKVREYIENLGHLELQNGNLLFVGESGTGKELVARAVHHVVSRGRTIPFVAQSCADIPAELMEATLFGHRRGSFTGSREDRPGIFELADGGVLFLDEIGELPLPLQASLLRVLEERTVARIGEPDKPRTLSLIVVCATNRDLAREVEAGRFRRDLFHRLSQVFRLPPLRERREDILPLIEHFMAGNDDFSGLTPEALFAPEVLLWFYEHDWPGNVRELKNRIEAIPVRIRARRHERVRLEDLGLSSLGLAGGPSSSDEAEATHLPVGGFETLQQFQERVERGFIRGVMEQSQWDITTAAERLGITYQGLRKRVLKYGWMGEVDKRR